MINKKTCSRCKNTKTHSDFYKRSSMSDGYDYYCKECRNYYTMKNAYVGSTICSIPIGRATNCTNPHYARKMCKNHYYQFRYHNLKTGKKAGGKR